MYLVLKCLILKEAAPELGNNCILPIEIFYFFNKADQYCQSLSVYLLIVVRGERIALSVGSTVKVICWHTKVLRSQPGYAKQWDVC